MGRVSLANDCKGSSSALESCKRFLGFTVMVNGVENGCGKDSAVCREIVRDAPGIWGG